MMLKQPVLLGQHTHNSRQVSVQQKKNNDEEAISGQEVWSAIRYLDPDTEAVLQALAHGK